MLLDRDKFDRIVQHARSTNPFYRDWIQDPAAVPILDRKTLLENNDRILNGNPVIVTTSGSTGIPIRIFMSARRLQLNLKEQKTLIGWLGGRLPAAQIIYPRAGLPVLDTLNISATIGEQIEFVLRRHREGGIVAITTYPTNAVMFANRVVELGKDFSFIKRVGLFSEPFEPWHRDAIRRAFPDAQIWSTYSALEVGMIAMQCPHEADFLHVMVNKLGVEVLDAEGNPVPENMPGRLVVTDYANGACPFIRYEIGDLVELAKCPCGKINLPAFGKIHGKVRGTLLRRDGQRTMFILISHLLAEIPGMRQFQVIQESVEQFTVRLVARQNIDEPVRAAFQEGFGYAPQIRTDYVDHIPRDPNGKFYSSICRV